MMRPGFTVAVMIPTGIGASIGGFGGDGMVLLPMLSSICDTVITHPNVANAACFQTLPSNTLYVEGYGLDQVFRGHWGLKPVIKNRIGIIWDSGICEAMETLHRNTIAGVETVYGVDVVGVQETSSPVGLEICVGESGRSTGKITNPDVLIEAGQALLEQGATALAVCCLMPKIDTPEDEQAYKQGQGVDPIAGLEAMISHLLVSHFRCPVAHAPVFDYEDALPVVEYLVDPRAASEFIVSTFLPCVLTGLAKAPQFYELPTLTPGIQWDDIRAVVVPADALGSPGVLRALEKKIPVLAVENNATVMTCDATALNADEHVIRCRTYLEAMGHLVALKAGIKLPAHIVSPSAVHHLHPHGVASCCDC